MLQASVATAQSESDRFVPATGGFFALPVELDLDHGAAGGDASILRIQPVYTFPVRDTWKLVNLDIFTLADAPSGLPEFPIEGGGSGKSQTFGIADFIHASFYTPKSTGNFVWGAGFIASIPMATDANLGSGKWAVGPAVRLTYRTGLWNFGLIAGQRWSFAGSSNRQDVNQLLLRGAIRRQLGNDWYFVSAPLIRSNWGVTGQKWVVPVGGGVGRKFTIGDYPWAFSAQGYYNVIKPDLAPDWVFRLAIIAAIPFGEK